MTSADPIRLTPAERDAVLLHIGFTRAELALPPGPPATVTRIGPRPRLRVVEVHGAERAGSA